MKETFQNAKSGVPSCAKCGNPIKMYYCYNCETNQEDKGECFMCGHSQGVKYVVVLDKDYHNNCS